ncbi:ferritin-like domain-containing protein [Acidicapsa dinghuensis]|uniref:Ferritin-like domain-containing protein n=1 Tax=Acidicapsa dinghuensis TaxID=2218256 RepID=A0ABW1EBR6_9BACT|nr:ferritin-like domain-containing protein [Acidicapsa dinghuensis]
MRDVDDFLGKLLTRRRFLAGAGTAAVLSAIGCGSSSKTTTTPPTGGQTQLTDADYLNFALNLEYLEASYYLIAATGSGLSATDMGSGAGTVTGGSMVPFSSQIQMEYANEIAQNELNHVRFLRQALGSAAVPMPPIDLVNSFNAAAMAAGIGPSFNPFQSFETFLVGAFVFEDVGVTAYSGAAPLLQNKTYLGAAAGIQAVEAYHAGEVRTLVLQAGSTYVGYANQISALRGQLGGGNETTLSATTIVAANPNTAIAYARTPQQVLNIVYATSSASASSGGFFPSGLNGNIKSTGSM